ncbi:hypothetical protein EGW08_018148 [Elysia chlorotica]|uniref:Uncharacterized protein n=1 Tax=Elysia chlorotica TaxID=188477 RepID=A0A3S0Z9Y4_ELYCH|nr:hypothetical protein EGW08_018148 [Elysia chlorotica]
MYIGTYTISKYFDCNKKKNNRLFCIPLHTFRVNLCCECEDGVHNLLLNRVIGCSTSLGLTSLDSLQQSKIFFLIVQFKIMSAGCNFNAFAFFFLLHVLVKLTAMKKVTVDA